MLHAIPETPAHPASVAPAAPDASPDVAIPPVATLDDLAALTAEQLRAVYCAATAPRFADLDGDFLGRMLALAGLRPGFWQRLLRRFAAWAHFPWRGKSFSPARAGQGGGGAADQGEGINRVFSDVRPRRWFRFETSIGPSRAGNFDAFHLDYDNPGNPFFIRAIEDEIRQVAPGLYLGQAYLATRKRTRLVLYFGLAAR